MTQTKQAVSNFGGERWEEVPGGDAQGSSGWLGRRPGACALLSSFWKRKSKRSLRALQLQCLGTSTEKSQDTPCSGAVPAQRPALGAEALFWFGGLGLWAGGASPHCGRVPKRWLLQHGWDEPWGFELCSCPALCSGLTCSKHDGALASQH